jgi:hypothetical protein
VDHLAAAAVLEAGGRQHPATLARSELAVSGGIRSEKRSEGSEMMLATPPRE